MVWWGWWSGGLTWRGLSFHSCDVPFLLMSIFHSCSWRPWRLCAHRVLSTVFWAVGVTTSRTWIATLRLEYRLQFPQNLAVFALFCLTRDQLLIFFSLISVFGHLASERPFGSLFIRPVPHKQETPSDCVSSRLWASFLQASLLWLGSQSSSISFFGPQIGGEKSGWSSWLLQGLAMGIWQLNMLMKSNKILSLFPGWDAFVGCCCSKMLVSAPNARNCIRAEPAFRKRGTKLPWPIPATAQVTFFRVKCCTAIRLEYKILAMANDQNMEEGEDVNEKELIKYYSHWIVN